MASHTRLLDLAARQGGFVLRTQLYEYQSRGTVWRKILRGEYADVTESIVRIFPLDGTVPLLRGAVLALPGAVVSHHSAALLHGFPRLHDRAEVTVPRHCAHRFERVEVHRTDDLTDEFVVSLDGLPVTSVARTIFDLAKYLPLPFLDDLVEEVLIGKKVTLDEIADVVRAVGRRGKHGTAAMRQVLADRGRGEYIPMSELERRGWRLVTSGVFPEPIREFTIPWSDRHRFDLAFPSQRVAVEWDSRRWHASLEAMDRDRRRDRECAANGWVLLRFTWTDVVERPHHVVASIAAVLRSRAKAH